MAIQHYPHCTDQSITYERTGTAGDRLRHCKRCGRYEVLSRAPKPKPTPPRAVVVAPAQQPVAAPVAPVVVVSRYRCPEHPDEPVTWRGTGCRACTNTRTNKRN